MTIDLSKLYLIEKQSLVKGLFYTGMLLAFLTSLRPWFLWSIHAYYAIFVSVLLGIAMLIDRTTSKPLFTNTKFLAPTIAYILLSYYQAIVGSKNIFGLLMPLFFTYIFFMLFRYDHQRLQQLSKFLAKSMAVILVPSLIFFFLYLFGFPLPSSDLVFGDNFYSFSNYYLFLLDDRQLLLCPVSSRYFPNRPTWVALVPFCCSPSEDDGNDGTTSYCSQPCSFRSPLVPMST